MPDPPPKKPEVRPPPRFDFKAMADCVDAAKRQVPCPDKKA